MNPISTVNANSNLPAFDLMLQDLINSNDPDRFLKELVVYLQGDLRVTKSIFSKAISFLCQGKHFRFIAHLWQHKEASNLKYLFTLDHFETIFKSFTIDDSSRFRVELLSLLPGGDPKDPAIKTIFSKAIGFLCRGKHFKLIADLWEYRSSCIINDLFTLEHVEEAYMSCTTNAEWNILAACHTLCFALHQKPGMARIAIHAAKQGLKEISQACDLFKPHILEENGRVLWVECVIHSKDETLCCFGHLQNDDDFARVIHDAHLNDDADPFIYAIKVHYTYRLEEPIKKLFSEKKTSILHKLFSHFNNFEEGYKKNAALELLMKQWENACREAIANKDLPKILYLEQFVTPNKELHLKMLDLCICWGCDLKIAYHFLVQIGLLAEEDVYKILQNHYYLETASRGSSALLRYLLYRYPQFFKDESLEASKGSHHHDRIKQWEFQKRVATRGILYFGVLTLVSMIALTILCALGRNVLSLNGGLIPLSLGLLGTFLFFKSIGQRGYYRYKQNLPIQI